MTTSIKDLRKSIADKKSELRALFEKGASDEPLSDEDDENATSLEKLIKDLCSRLDRMESIRDSAAEDASDVEERGKDDDDDDDDKKDDKSKKGFGLLRREYNAFEQKGAKNMTKDSNLVIRHAQAKNEPPMTKLTRFIIGNAAAKVTGSKSFAANYIKDNFGDHDVAKALNTTAVTAGGALIPQDFLADPIELLYAEAVVVKSGVMQIQAPRGNFTIPRVDSGATAYWTPEGTEMIISQQTFDDVQFSAKKLTVLVPVSNDLMRRAPMALETLLRADIMRQGVNALDLALMVSDGTGNRPLGLIALAQSIVVPVTSGTPLFNVLQTIMSYKFTLESANVTLDGCAWITTFAVKNYLLTITDSTGRAYFAEDISKGMLQGIPLYCTNQLPCNMTVGANHDGSYLILYKPGMQVLANTLDWQIDTSSEASYNNAGTMTSAYDRDQTLIRLIQEMDFNTRHPQSIVTGVVEWFPLGATLIGGASYITQAPGTTGSSAGSTQPG
jgi:HK97 family phage major capsid protein